MKRSLRTACIALAIVFCLLLALMFGRYPTPGIPADTVKIEVRRSWDGPAMLTLTREEDIREAREIVGWVWNGMGHNSGVPGVFFLVFTGKDGVETRTWVSPEEWGDHARMPKGFISFLERKQAGD
ncbi:MAG: hypothetical protein ACO1TE_17430 [Prosthecobacter sp.]